MKKLVMGLFMVLMSFQVFACDFSGSGLTDAMKQKLKVECETMKLAVKETPEPVIPNVTKEDVSEWATISQEFAKALGIAAREVGSSVNDFMMTPAGLLTCVVLAWMIFGKALLGIFLGFIMTMIVVWFNKRLWFSHIDVIESEGRFFGKNIKRVNRYLKWEDMTEAACTISFLSAVALGVFWLVLIIVAVK